MMTQVNKSEPSAAESTLDALLRIDVFRALSDPTRVGLLTRLATTGPTTVSALAECCPVDLSVVSRHLKILRDAGILASERQGRRVRYRVRVADLVADLRALADALEACCPADPTITDDGVSP